MKKILLGVILLSGSYLFAGNGGGGENPPCNCALPDQVNIYAAGTASIDGNAQVRCNGETGTCWEVVFKPSGGWELTIYVEPPLHFGNASAPDDPPVGPWEVDRKEGYVIYEWNPEIWEFKN